MQLPAGRKFHPLARICAALVLCATLSLGSAAARGAGTGANSDGAVPLQAFIPGQLLVRFDPASTPGQRREALDRIGGKVEESVGIAGIALVDFSDAAGVGAADRELSSDAAIDFADPNTLAYPDETLPTEMYFTQQWALRNTGQTVNGVPGVVDADVDAPLAWDRGTGSRAVTIGIMDTGVLHTHPDLAANMWVNPGEIPGNGIDDDANGYKDDVNGYDFADDDANPDPDLVNAGTGNVNGHGTHVAGIAGAVGNNATGISGAVWATRLVSLKVFKDGAAAPLAVLSDRLEAFAYAKRQGLDIVNASLGCNVSAGCVSSNSERAAIAAAPEILFVFSAGNSSADNDLDPAYPSNYATEFPNVISVASTNSDDTKRSSSNYGAASVTLGAPGGNIYSTGRPGFEGPYSFRGGTSMAAPLVAGGAALLLSDAPLIPPDAIRRRIITTVDHIPSMAGITVSGGRLNLDRMTIPPETTFTSGPAAQTVGGEAADHVTFGFATDQAEAVFECSTDGSAFAPCNGAGANSASYAEGSHQFAVRANFYGLADPTPAIAAFIVDRTGAKAKIQSGPEGSTSSHSAKFALRSELDARFECKLDKKPFRGCRSPLKLHGLGRGSHKLAVRATDRFGNVGTPAKRTWRIVRPKRAPR